MSKRESFQDFYYRNVGIGEGCGCAESVIDVYEAQRNGDAQALQESEHRTGNSFLTRLAARLGLKAPR